ncbi:MAG TPA: hypothetical protein VHH72_10885 [Solirubrobacterales bacterium]|jgi:hypothetical protein|nr:hypothetical protein [Solirubrobacterales bacterium]
MRVPAHIALAAAVIVLGLAPAAAASPGSQIGSGTAQGGNLPVAAASSKAFKPSELRVRVESDPKVDVKASVTVSCLKQKGAGNQTGSRTTIYTLPAAPDTRKAKLPLKRPDSCRISATLRFTDAKQGGSLKVTLFARLRK